jgi:hypothetical protein
MLELIAKPWLSEPLFDNNLTAPDQFRTAYDATPNDGAAPRLDATIVLEGPGTDLQFVLEERLGVDRFESNEYEDGERPEKS